MSAPHPFLSHRYRAAAAAAIAAFLECQGWVLGERLSQDSFLPASGPCCWAGWAPGGGGAVAHGAHCWPHLTLLLTAGPGCCWAGQGLSGGTEPGKTRLCPHPTSPQSPSSQALLQLWPCGWCSPPCSVPWQWCTHQAPSQPVMQPGRGAKPVFVYFTFYYLLLGN